MKSRSSSTLLHVGKNAMCSNIVQTLLTNNEVFLMDKPPQLWNLTTGKQRSPAKHNLGTILGRDSDRTIHCVECSKMSPPIDTRKSLTM